ncbi:MAG: hypothetical protein GKR94_32175 [Gammaproteobacteria bacterium]|nr:hypothetical protein [Gammaproteobacteria bacterium]
MKRVPVAASVLVDLIWNAELLSVGMANDAVEWQTAILRGDIPKEAFYPHGRRRSQPPGKSIDLLRIPVKRLTCSGVKRPGHPVRP